MGSMIELTIDDQAVSVPAGTLVVDAAKKIGNNIPVFCYHPKMEPVGMCRMCLVDIGRPVVDRETGNFQLDVNGNPIIKFGPKLETACTTPVSQGMVVVTNSELVEKARREVIEFLLTSHPLDCPVCDKGGECPLQNLTMAHGPGTSQFDYADKKHLAKHVPLGELIMLDRERCIQCGRCVRFQSEIVDDPVIGFYQRGRSLEIMSFSEPGFDSIFSGNTTDICPVGALTTRDFRFGARPWEMNFSPSVCNHCPVGCNIVYNVRREARSNGNMVIKRVMPRQNEQVNEIWMCDKGRFTYHYTENKARLTQPLLRVDDDLVPITWDDAYSIVARKMVFYGADMLTLVGGRLANEDLFNFAQLTSRQGGKAILHTYMGGGDLTAKVGVGKGTDIAQMGAGDVILVAACDLHQEAPVWWLRVKQAAERGVKVISVNARATRLDKHAAHVVRYEYGHETDVISAFLPDSGSEDAAVQAFQQAKNAIIFYGSDGLGLKGSQSLADMCARALVETEHVGKPNNGLIGVWSSGNLQGAWEMGFKPVADLANLMSHAGMVFIAGADPAGDDPVLAEALKSASFVVVNELFLTETTKLADLVLPVQASAEREGTYTSGERRVQRFFRAVPPRVDTKPDFEIAANISNQLSRDMEGRSPVLIMDQMAASVPAFKGITYAALSEPVEQWPIIGREDLYYGGTSYENNTGIGIQLEPTSQSGQPVLLTPVEAAPILELDEGMVRLAPVTNLYDNGNLALHTELLSQRWAASELRIDSETAAKFGLVNDCDVRVKTDKCSYLARICIDEQVPAGVALIPRSAGFPVCGPQAAVLSKPEAVTLVSEPLTE